MISAIFVAVSQSLILRYTFRDSIKSTFTGEPMSLSSEEINHIALLARLDLTDAEKAKAATELSQILDSFEKLKELDTDNVTPAESALNLVNVLRVDEVQPSLPTEAALANAPEQAANMFVVPRVVEAE